MMSAARRDYVDTIFMALPRALEPLVAGDTLYVREMAQVVRRLSDIAEEQLLTNYPYARLKGVQWLFFTEVDQARTMELPHDCADCREGKDRAIIILRDDPTHIVAFGTMYVDEPVTLGVPAP